MTTKYTNRWWVLLSVFTLILFAIIVPPFQSPDEPAHLRYIQFISEYKTLPSPSIMADASLLNSSPIIANSVEELETSFIARNPNYHFQYHGNHNYTDEPPVFHYIFNHPPLYYIWGAFFFSLLGSESIILKLLILRILNSVFILIAGAYVYRVAKALKFTQLQTSLIVVLTLMWPMFQFVSAGINNDVLVTVASIALITICIELIRNQRNHTVFLLLELGFWVNVGLLTKAQFAPLIPIALVLLAYLYLKKQFRFSSILLFLLSLTPSAIYYIDKVIRYGTMFPTPMLLENSQNPSVGTAYVLNEVCTNLHLVEYLKVLLYPRLPMILQSFVGNFGWLDTKVPLAALVLFLIAIVVAFIGLCRYFYRSIVQKAKINLQLLVPISAIILLEIFYIYLYIRTYMPDCYLYFPVQGRYYFPILLPLMLLIVFGFSHAIPKRYHSYAYVSLIVLSLFYTVYAVTLILQRYYL